MKRLDARNTSQRNATMHESSQRLVWHLTRVGREDPKRISGLFKRHDVVQGKGVEALVHQIEFDGANSIASLVRGHRGVPYVEIARDVARKLKVQIPKDREEDEVFLERQALFSMLTTYFEKGSPADREALLEELRAKNPEIPGRVAQGGLTAAMWTLVVRRIGARAVAQVVRAVVLRSTGWFAARQAAKTAAEIAGLAIPVLDVLLTAWLVADIASPAMRKTIPTVMDIALTRMEFEETRG